jgi:radical SAM superfamily enzyme YgiQ (UPF0313 family)
MTPSVLLVNYAGYVVTSNTFVADNSLATLAGTLLARGIPVRILDFQNAIDIGHVGDRTGSAVARRMLGAFARGDVQRELHHEYRERRAQAQRETEAGFTARLLGEIAERDATLVGFKLWAGNGLPAMLSMAEAVRARFPRVRLVAGGPAVTLGAARIRARTSAFDHLVTGDGERAIVELATGAPTDEIVALGRRTRRGGGIAYDGALDDLPPPSYAPNVYPGLDAFFRIRVIDESRGCFNHCAFCAHPFLNGVTRLKSAARVADEMQRTLEQDGVRTFRLSGSNPPWKHLRAIAAEIRRRRLDVRFSAFASMNNVRAADLEELAGSGLAALFFGIESGDPDVLRRAHHKNNVDNRHVVEVVRAASEARIFSCLSAIVPSPFESPDSRARTLELLCSALGGGRLGSALVLPPFPVPGSTWWNRLAEFGFELAPGTDRDALLDSLLDWDNDFLLPRELGTELGFALHGRRSSELFHECGAFLSELAREGIQTNVDDASFMIGQISGMPAGRYQRRMQSSLVLGGSQRLLGVVRRINSGGEAHPPPHRRQGGGDARACELLEARHVRERESVRRDRLEHAGMRASAPEPQ